MARGEGNRRDLPHVWFFLFLERNQFARWLCLVVIVIFLLTLLFASEEEHGTKVIFPVPGMTTKCPVHIDDAVKECHSIPSDPNRLDDVLDSPGTYVIRIR